MTVWIIWNKWLPRVRSRSRLLCDLLLYIHANYKKDLGIHTLSKVYATSIILISSSNATSGETIRSTPFDETNWTTFISRDQIAKGVTAEKHVINLPVLAKSCEFLSFARVLRRVNSVSDILRRPVNYRWRKTPNTRLSVKAQSSIWVEPSTFPNSAGRLSLNESSRSCHAERGELD